MNKILAIPAAAVLLSGAGWWAMQGDRAPLGQSLIPAAQAETATTAAPAEAPATSVKNHVIGAPDAKVRIVEYASFTCPHCAHFHDAVWDRLKAEYIDTGKVQFEYREVYFDRFGLWAAMVARCGGEARYFGIADLLFEKQKEWVQGEDPAAIVAQIKAIGRSAGMEDAAMETCLQDQDTAKALVQQFETQMAADGVEGTPTLFINGEKHGNMGYDELKALIDAELAK